MNILALTYWSYKDALIQTYTLPYIKIIRKNLPIDSKIFLVTLEQPATQFTKIEYTQIKAELSKYNIHLLPFKYYPFGIKATLNALLLIFSLIKICLTCKIKFIHAWCTPAGSIGYLLSKITKIKLILDSYEPHAEAMVENNDWKRSGFAFKILFYFERLQTLQATTFIATTAGMKYYALDKYGVDLKNFYVKPACVDLQKFSFNEVKRNELRNGLNWSGKIICIYAGKVGGIYLDKEIFDFFKEAHLFWGEKFRVLMLTPTSPQIIKQLATQANLPTQVLKIQSVSHNEVSDYMSIADFALNPVKPVPSKRYCTSIKDGEYWAMGLPIVITKNISDDTEIIENNNIGAVLNKLSKLNYLEAVKKIDTLLINDNPPLRKRIRAIATEYRGYTIAEHIYREIYNIPHS
jgi:glycosyltransferase involved in cell wall biosynthesis